MSWLMMFGQNYRSSSRVSVNSCTQQNEAATEKHQFSSSSPAVTDYTVWDVPIQNCSWNNESVTYRKAWIRFLLKSTTMTSWNRSLLWKSLYTRDVWKVCGLALLLRVGTLWRCGDGLFFEVPPLASDALLTTLQTVCRKLQGDSGTGGAPFSRLEKPRNRMDCMAVVLMGFHRSTFSRLNTEFNCATLMLR
jgi:hypothetical protein